MSDQPDNLIPVYLRRLDEKLDRVIGGTANYRPVATAPPPVIAGLDPAIHDLKLALLHNDFARQSERINRIETRLERIDRRLDIVGAAE